MILSIIYFLLVTIGFSFIVDLFVKWEADYFEQFFMRIGLGIGMIPIFGVLFNLLNIPIDFIIFGAIALILPLVVYFKHTRSKSKVKAKKSKSLFDFDAKEFFSEKRNIYYVLILIMFFITSYMYIQGSFNSPAFENGDPYSYGLSTKFIAEEKTYSSDYHFTHYAEPYTQGYQIFLGIMHQSNDSIYWTMKFFSSLIISLAIVFFFFFVRKFTKSDDIGFYATVALFAIPAWLSHFIFSLNFNMALFPLFLYSVLHIKDNKKWKYPVMIVFSSILINHAYTALTIMMFFIAYYLVKVFVEGKISEDYIHVGFYSLVISLFFYVPSLLKYKDFILREKPIDIGGLDRLFPFFYDLITQKVTVFIGIIAIGALVYYYRNQIFKPINNFISKDGMKPMLYFGFFTIIFAILIIPTKKFIAIKGTATRDYVFNDFFIAQSGNYTNNPIGIGSIIMTFFVLGLILILFNYKKLFTENNLWLGQTLTWVILSSIFLFGTYFSVMYIPFRMWTFFAFFTAIIFGFVVNKLVSLINQESIKWLVVILIVILTIPTSFSQKYTHNTVPWSEHQIMVPDSVNLYVWMREGGIPKDSMVTNLCHREYLMSSYDMMTRPWETEDLAERKYFKTDGSLPYYKTALNVSLEDNYNFLKRNNFDFVTIGASCAAKFELDEGEQALLLARVNEMINSTKFIPVKSTGSELLFRII